MSINPTRPTADPLDVARQQLNFEAMAEQAPSVKEVLFKAQTIVPITVARPWEKIGKSAGLLGAAALLLFAPLIPDSASIALVSVQFEQQKFTRDDAQTLVYDVLRDLPEDVLLGASFSRTPGQPQESADGKLQLSLVKFHASKADITSVAAQAIESKPRASQPFYSAVTIARNRAWKSIPQALGGALQQDGHTPNPPLDQFKITKDILKNEQLIGKGLADYYDVRDRRMVAFSWLDSPSVEPEPPYNFVLPAWPRWVGVGVEGYELMLDQQQAETRLIAEEYLKMLNLNIEGPVFCREAGGSNPVLVSVITPQDTADGYLSSLVQARLAPGLAKLDMLTEASVTKLVTSACEAVLPRNEFTVDIRPASEFIPGHNSQAYKAVIRVSDQYKSSRWRLDRDPLEAVEESVEF